MELNRGIGTLVLVLFFIEGTLTAIIVPQPDVAVLSATSYTVTLNWTMPRNELYDGFTIEVHALAEKVRRFDINDTNLVVDRLVPGLVYSFLVRAYRGSLFSDVSVVLQDTIPLPPTNLRLEYFHELLLSIDGPYFGPIEFTLNVPGVEAVWEGPHEGDCDCYIATISPNDGRVALPAQDDRGQTVTSVRRFIHLVPGQTYTIGVRSTTCGNGYLGSLHSPEVTGTITLPPADPPAVIPEDVTNTTGYLSWERGGIIPGFYDDFEVALISDTDDPVTVEMAPNPRHRGRNVTGLRPCSTYEFEVTTLNRGMRSINSQRAEVHTRPTPPSNLVVTDFGETFIAIKWRIPRGSQGRAGFKVSVEDVLVIMRPATSTDARLPGLIPGTVYKIDVTTECLGSDRTESDPATVSQVTIPQRPETVSGICTLLPTDVSDPSSVINLSWLPPAVGGWDGFVVDYSPFEFNGAQALPAPPISLSRDTYNLSITVPATGRIFTTYIRTTKRELLSDAYINDVPCEDDTGDKIRQCRLTTLIWSIKITEVNATHLFIEVSPYPIVNITVELSIRPYRSLVTTKFNFYILNPCKGTDASQLRILVYPECPPDLTCPPFVRKICRLPVATPDGPLVDLPATPPGLRSNACCNARAFHTSVSKCCHGKLADTEQLEMQCCYTRWYNRTSHKCCGESDGEGQVQPLSSQCIS